MRENRHLAGDLEGHIPALRRYARGLIGMDCPDPTASADALVREAVERTLRAAATPDARRSLYATLTSLNRRRRRAAPTPPDAGGRKPPKGLREALAAAPLENREALLLVIVEGFSYAEAANILGLSRMGFANRLTRARLHLNGALDAGLTGETRPRSRHPPYLRLVK